MRIALAVVLLVAACGSVRSPGVVTPSPSPSPAVRSAYADAVASPAAFLDVQAYLPEALPGDLIATVALYAAPSPERGQRTLGDPVLAVTFTKVPNGKPVLSLLQGAPGCCADLSGAASSPIAIREPDVRGELIQPRGASQGPTLRWREPSGTEIALAGSPFGEFRDEQALLALARSMRAVARVARGGAVLAYWSTHESHSPAGHRVFIATRSAPVPEAARLLDDRGNVLATAPFSAPKEYDCLAAAAGVAALAVPLDVLHEFRPDMPARYRAEVLTAGAWRSVQLVAAGCFSIE